MNRILKLINSLLRLSPRKMKLVNTHQISIKNKWLNPQDNFGKLERGVEYDEK